MIPALVCLLAGGGGGPVRCSQVATPRRSPQYIFYGDILSAGGREGHEGAVAAAGDHQPQSGGVWQAQRRVHAPPGGHEPAESP